MREVERVLHDRLQEIKIEHSAAPVEAHLLLDDLEQPTHVDMIAAKLLDDLAHSQTYAISTLVDDPTEIGAFAI